MSDITLQINLSAVDAGYAQWIAPNLMKAHSHVSRKVAIVDCCRPQKTKYVDPKKKFPEPDFTKKVEKICWMAENLKTSGYFDQIYYLTKDHPILKQISKKYFHGLIRKTETHEAGGTALMAYLAAYELCETDYLLHYDADLFLFQEEGYDWATEAKQILDSNPLAIAAAPRTSPPQDAEKDLSAFYWRSAKPAMRLDQAWSCDWFSSRVFLIDLRKLKKYLPLLSGPLLLKAMAKKIFQRGFPPSPEAIFSKRIVRSEGFKLHLKTPKAWFLHLHANDKNAETIRLIPKILEYIHENRIPALQFDSEDIIIPAWQAYLKSAL